MSYRQAQLASIVIGILLAVAVMAGAYAVIRTHTVERAQVRTDAEIASIARRVFRLEQPNQQESSARVIRALKLCAADAKCAAAVRNAAPRGRTGARGPQGPRGPVGSTGSTGQRGVAGASGSTGQRGLIGPPGPVGSTGANGAAPVLPPAPMPGPGSTPPGQGGTPPGQGGTPPGQGNGNGWQTVGPDVCHKGKCRPDKRPKRK
jgi:hypothetical protein